MIIKDIQVFSGEHCETTATGTLLLHLGIHLSEPLLFGIGEGLGFIVWNMKNMGFPFIGGRIKPDILTFNITRNLNLVLEVKETSSVKKAWHLVEGKIKQNQLVGLKLDCFHLDYFTHKVHFAAHYAALYGFDDEFAYLVDTQQQGGKVKTSLKSLELARNEKGAMSSHNLMYTITCNHTDFNIEKVLITALKNNAKEYLNPPISNIGYRGIHKTSSEIKKWFKSCPNIKDCFTTMAIMMEKAGTGGALFRNLYRDFLKESFEITCKSELKDVYYRFLEIASKWNQVASLFDNAGRSSDIQYIYHASEILLNIAEEERTAMEIINDIKS